MHLSKRVLSAAVAVASLAVLLPLQTFAAYGDDDSSQSANSSSSQSGDNDSVPVTQKPLSFSSVLPAAASTVASGTWGTAPWNINSDGILTIGAGSLGVFAYVYNNIAGETNVSPWKDYLSSIKKVVFSNPTKTSLNMYSGGMFWNMVNLTEIDGLGDVDVSGVYEASYMFYNAKSLKTLDLSKWNTGNFNNVENMFNGTTALTTLNVSTWNTSNVKTMAGMFKGASSLTALDLSKWTVPLVTTMASMFEGDSSLISLNVSTWTLPKVENLAKVFYGVSSLYQLDLSSWNLAAAVQYDIDHNIYYGDVSSRAQMFTGMYALRILTLGPGTRLNPEQDVYYYGSGLSLSGSGINDLWIEVGAGTISAPQGPWSGTSWELERRSRLAGNPAGTYVAQAKEGWSLVFDPNGGTGSITKMTGAMGSAAGALPSGTAFTRTGYTFTGWNTQADGKGTAYAAGATGVYPPVGTTTLYAQWKGQAASVVFNANGGSGTMTALTGVTGQTLALTANSFTRTGYTFTGWNTQADGKGVAYAAGASVTLSAVTLTLYAQWKGQAASVVFNPNGGTGTMTALTGLTGETVTLPANTFTFTGHLFVEWNTEANGTGLSYVAGASVTLPAGTTTLYAQWKGHDSSIVFDANGGKGTMVALTGFSGDAVTLTARSFTRDGYVFAGWNTQADGGGTMYADKASVTLSTGTLTLYAQWVSWSKQAPGLPLTGGMGEWMFKFAGVGVLALAGVALAGRTWWSRRSARGGKGGVSV